MNETAHWVFCSFLLPTVGGDSWESTVKWPGFSVFILNNGSSLLKLAFANVSEY